MDCLKILIIGLGTRVAGELEQAGHAILAVPDCAEAAEALLVQRFDAVLVAPVPLPADLLRFRERLSEADRHAGSRTPILSLAASEAAAAGGAFDIFDGTVQESLDADALTLAIARLASAVSVDKGSSDATPLHPELPILEIEPLKEQVAYDNELLLELIDLYFSERAKQSAEMAEALLAGDYDRLSRVAHTIKGSLGSLHATAARMTAQALEYAARDGDAASCHDFLPVFEHQLDLLQLELERLRDSLSAS